jgi:hypothetical protein
MVYAKYFIHFMTKPRTSGILDHSDISQGPLITEVLVLVQKSGNNFIGFLEYLRTPPFSSEIS